MTEFIPIVTTSDKLDSVLVNNGQLIFVVDTKKIYIDLDRNTRTEMAGLSGSDFLSKLDPVATGSFSLNGMPESHSGDCSVELGQHTNARGAASMAVGSNTIATADSQFVCGRYNIIDDEGKFVFIVGGGDAIGSERNLLTIDFNGNMEVAGNITDGNGNSFSNVLNFETLTRMLTAGEHAGIKIEVATIEDGTKDGQKYFKFTIDSLPEISIDADGYWTINGERAINAKGDPVQARGLSAYEVAVSNGFKGDTGAWLASLKGEPGVSKSEITTKKKDFYCTLDKNLWFGNNVPPYVQEVTVNGITENMNPRVDIIISDDLSTGRMELNEYCNITRILTYDGKIRAECYRVPPSIDLNLQIEVI